jgi:DNA-binding NtrC family response regulator
MAIAWGDHRPQIHNRAEGVFALGNTMTTDSQKHPTLLSLDGGDAQPLSIRAKALVFADPASRHLLSYIEKLAPSEAPVLISGETGTGKELVARHIHQLSGRTGPFLAVNCGAISDHLAESELFGHEAGSFTGAVGRREGWFEAANGGTLFLDEIGDLPLAMQVKLLRVLQEREVVRIGSRKSIAVDIRLVAATNIDLDHAVSAGRFRIDLLYRLNIAQARLPPLRERPGDVLPLAQHFLRTYSQRMNIPEPDLSPAAGDALRGHAWPGNIRELENVIHFALLISSAEEIRPEHLKVSGGWGTAASGEGSSAAGHVPVVAPDEAAPLQVIAAQLRRSFARPCEALYDELEQLIVTEAYRHCGNNQVHSAALLGVTRNVLRTLLKRHGLLEDSAIPPPERTQGRIPLDRSWLRDAARI